MATALFDAVISAEDEGAGRFPSGKTTVVRNYVLDEEYESLTPASKSSQVARVLYVGSMSPERGIPELVRALPSVAGDRTVELVLLGAIDHMLDELSSAPNWDQVRAPGYADRTEVVRELRRADVAALLLHPTEKYAAGAVPVKLFEYMAAGLPVVASDLPTIREVVREARCGLLVNPLNPDEIKAALLKLLDAPELAAEMGDRGRAIVARSYSWSTEGDRLVQLYDALVQRRGWSAPEVRP